MSIAPLLLSPLCIFFRDCPLAIDVWNIFIDHHLLDRFYNLDFNNWVQTNLSNSFSSSCSFTWNKVWVVDVWQLWFWRNALVHIRDFRRPFRPVEIIRQILCDFDQGKILLESHIESHVQRSILVTWNKPDAGWVKLNCDGALKSASGCASCGGLLRGVDCRWIRGFCRFLGDVSIHKAEAWAMLEGLRLATSFGVAQLIFESDSLLLVNVVNELANCPVEIQGIVHSASDALACFHR